MFGMVRLTFRQLWDNLRKSSEIGRKSSEHRQKHRYVLSEFYMIERKLHGRLEIRNFSSHVQKYFTRSLRSHLKINKLSTKNRINQEKATLTDST